MSAEDDALPPNRWLRPDERGAFDRTNTFFHYILDTHPGTIDIDRAFELVLEKRYPRGALLVPIDHPAMPMLTEWAREHWMLREDAPCPPPEIAGVGVLREGARGYIHQVRAYVLPEDTRRRTPWPGGRQ